MDKGFTLIELAIVLTIVGLLIAGVVGGQSLVRHAELQSVIKDILRYKTAVATFKLEYGSLPGDFGMAGDYWPGVSGGDEDGSLKTAPPRENLLAWQHLALDGLIPGVYSGSGFNLTIGINVPGSKIEDAGYQIRGPAPAAVTGMTLPIFDRGENNFIVFGAISGIFMQKGILIPQEARTIDRKMDDGIARTGEVFGYDHRPALLPTKSCLRGTVGIWEDGYTDGEYNLELTEDGCMLIFWID